MFRHRGLPAPSADSNVDLATTVIFTDDPLTRTLQRYAVFAATELSMCEFVAGVAICAAHRIPQQPHTFSRCW